MAIRAVMSNVRGPFATPEKVNEGHGVEDPAAAAVSDRYAKPGSWVSLSQARSALEDPVLFRLTRKVTGSPGFPSDMRPTIVAVRFASTSCPNVRKYMSVGVPGSSQPPPRFRLSCAWRAAAM